MDDAEYIYKQDVKEKAITARSSHKYGSSRRRRCGPARPRTLRPSFLYFTITMNQNVAQNAQVHGYCGSAEFSFVCSSRSSF